MKRAALAVFLAMTLAPSSALAVRTAAVRTVSSASTYTASSSRAPTVHSQSPYPGSRQRTFFPQFAATIDARNAPVNRSSVHLYVDGQDVTASTSVTENTVNYMPRARVGAGWHDVFLEGADTAGQTFSDAWVFQSEAPDVNDPPPTTGGFAFFPAGGTHFAQGNDFMHFFFLSPFNGIPTLQLCGFSQLGFIHVAFTPVFFTTVPLTFGDGFSPFIGCNAGVFFTPFTPFNGINTVFLPVTPIPPIGIAGPQVTPNIPITQGVQRTMQPGIVRYGMPLPVTGGTMPSATTAIGSPRTITPIYPAIRNYPAPMTAPQIGVPRSALPVMRMPMPAMPASRPIPHAPAAPPPVAIPHPIPH
jgi:hypothetical protein